MTYCYAKGQIPYFETSARDGANVDQAFEGTILPSPRLKKVAPQANCRKLVVAIARNAQEEAEIDYFGITINPHFEEESGGCNC